MQPHFLPIVLLLALNCPLQILTADTPSLTKVKAQLELGQEPVRIVCFGDSVTGVYYHSGGRRAWSDMLGIALKKQYPKAQIEVFNAGISGNTTIAALGRIERDVIARKPNLVAMMFGLNDIADGNRQVYRENLKTMIHRCREAGAEVVLCTLNSVYPNQPRPMPVVSEYSEIVREVARENAVPLADCFRAYEAVRSENPTAWKLLMNEDIHPGMEGHKLFAETVAKVISGKPVSLADVPPPTDALKFSLARLRAGQPVSVIAMPPYDRIVRDVLLELYPKAEVNVTTWPVSGDLSAMVEWAKGIRGKQPNLVIAAVPANADAKNEEAYIRDYNWLLSWSTSFDQSRWDVLPILPTVTGPVAAEERPRADLAQRIITGHDLESIDRSKHDKRPAQQIVMDWIRERVTRP